MLRPWYLVYDDTNPNPEPPTPTPEPTPTPPPAPKSFTQEEVNRMLADDRRKHQQQVQKHVADLENLRKSTQLTQKERDELQTRIEELQNSVLTKEELARKEQEKLRNTHKQEVESLSKERDRWKTSFETSTIKRAITDASVSAEAFNPAQIVRILERDSRLTEVLDADGQPTGEFETRVKFQDTDKNGKPVTLDLTVPEALKRMKDLPETYGNLFKGSAVSGLGATRTDQVREKDLQNMDPNQYREWRKKQGFGRK